MLKSLFATSGLLLIAATLAAREPIPVLRAHAHNDYEHTRPLVDALEHGFCNIEADVWLVDGQLLVAHDRKNARPERTLRALYLEPLQARVRAHGGRVYRNGPTVVLLIDVKSEAVATYAALREVLASYDDMLTTFRGTAIEPKAVTIIISGNRATAEMGRESIRHAAVDGRGTDLDTNPPAALVPWISEDWRKRFTWQWDGPMPAATRDQLKAFADRVHAQGRKLRFWNTPDTPDAWRTLLDAGVDLIGTNDFSLETFLLDHARRR